MSESDASAHVVGLDDRTLSALEQLAEKLGTTSEYLIQIFALRAYGYIAEIIFSVLLVVAAVVVLTLAIRKCRKLGAEVLLDNSEPSGAAAVILALSGMLLALFASIAITQALPGAIRIVLSPEAYAVSEILQLIR